MAEELSNKMEKMSINDDSASDVVCKVCELGNNEEMMVLCDGCETGFHTYCINLPGVPQEETWLCPKCVVFKMRPQEQQQNVQQNRDPLAPGSQVVLYLRVSSRGQDDAANGRVGLETQNYALLQYALNKNYKIIHTYTDVGSGRNDNRKQFNKMLDDLPPNTSVLVYSVSRFSRNVDDVTIGIQRVHSRGGVVFSVMGECVSTSNEFMVLARQSQQESDNLSQVVQQSLQRRRELGAHIGPAPYGKEVYRDDTGMRCLRDNQGELHVLRQMQQMEGGYTAIARVLNERNIPYRDGRQWSGDIVSRILRRN